MIWSVFGGEIRLNRGRFSGFIGNFLWLKRKNKIVVERYVIWVVGLTSNDKSSVRGDLGIKVNF